LSIRLICSIFLAMSKKAELRLEKAEARPRPGPADLSAEKVAAAEKTETGGPAGPEPTRYGDWEKNGRCSDF